MSGTDSRLVAAVIVDNTQAIPASKAVGDAMVDALKRTEEANRKLEEAEKKITAAMQTKISASKQVENAINAQTAAGKPLQEELARLKERYDHLNAAMQNSARGGRGVPTELAAEAARVRSAIGGIESQIKALSTTGGSEMPAFVGSIGQLVPAFTLASLAADGLRSSFTASVEFMKSAVTEAGNAEQVTIKLSRALAAQGRDVDAESKRILEYSKAREHATAFDDEAITTIQTQLIMYARLRGEGLERATNAVMNMVAAGKEQEGSTIALAKAANGHGEALAKLGITFEKTGDKVKDFDGLLDKLDQRFGGQAEAELESYDGKVKAVTAAWGDFKEEVGNQVLPVVKDMLDGFRELSHALEDQVASQGPLFKFFDFVSQGSLTSLANYKKFRDGLNEDPNETTLREIGDHMERVSAQIAKIRAAGPLKGQAILDLTDKQRELDHLSAQFAELSDFIESRRKKGGGPDDEDDSAATKSTGAKAHALSVAAEIQRDATARSKEYVDAQIREGDATDDISLRIAQLATRKKQLIEQAIEEGRVSREASDAKIVEANAVQDNIDQLKKEQEAKKQAVAAHRALIEAQINEKNETDPLKQKLEDLRLQRLELARAILLQKGATGELTAEDRAALAVVDEQINATNRQISDQQRVTAASKTAAAESARAYQQAGISIASSMGSAFGSLITGQEKASTVVKREAISLTNTLVQMAIKQAIADRAVANAKISNAAGVAGANEFEATSTLGPPGLAIGAAAAAAVISSILAEKSFLSASGGGKLRGGIPGVDSIPVLAMQDENILKVDTNRRLENMLDVFERGGLQTSANAVAPIGDIHVHLPPSTNGVGPSVAEVGRMISDRVIPAIIQAANAGKLDAILNARSR